jgi:sulfate/thiosulfate transport system permease protein
VGAGQPVNTPVRLALVSIGFLYIGLIVLLPFANVFYQAFHNGLEPFIESITDPFFLHAIQMTLLLALVAVPINTVFGVIAAIQVRGRKQLS